MGSGPRAARVGPWGRRPVGGVLLLRRGPFVVARRRLAGWTAEGRAGTEPGAEARGAERKAGSTRGPDN